MPIAALGPLVCQPPGQRPVIYFSVLIAISAIAYVPLALAFTPWAWSNSGLLSVQWCRPLLYGVYFFAGVGIGAAGIDVGLVAADGALGRRWKLWLAAAIASLFLWMGVTVLDLGRSGAGRSSKSPPLCVSSWLAPPAVSLSSPRACVSARYRRRRSIASRPMPTASIWCTTTL